LSAAAAAPARIDAEAASRALAGATPRAVIRWAAEAFAPGRLALVSAFGPGSAVLLHFLEEAGVSVPVVFVDTLHHFPETLEHVERVRDGGAGWVDHRPAPRPVGQPRRPSRRGGRGEAAREPAGRVDAR
jgi:3'-phosphoadenosine 5'-phosphosulfate sulfotransferase (PAPS reductase)/FAD synthetase